MHGYDVHLTKATVMCSMPGPIINHATPQIVRNSALNFVGSRRIFRTISHYFALFRAISHYFALFRTISHYFALFRAISHFEIPTSKHYFALFRDFDMLIDYWRALRLNI